MTTTKLINVGNCKEDRSDCVEGAVFNPDKVHNCNTCGYYQSYNNEMIEFNTVTKVVEWSSVKDMV